MSGMIFSSASLAVPDSFTGHDKVFWLRQSCHFHLPPKLFLTSRTVLVRYWPIRCRPLFAYPGASAEGYTCQMATPTPVQPRQVGILILDDDDNSQGPCGKSLIRKAGAFVWCRTQSSS